MALRITANRTFGQDKVFNVPNPEFSQEDFDHLLKTARLLKIDLQNNFNLRDDLGEDVLLISITDTCIQEFGGINYQLIHIVYRIIDNEVEQGSMFTSVHFQY